MKTKRGMWMMATLVGLTAFVGAPQQAYAQDIGVQMEQEYGVLGNETREGRQYNQMLDSVVDRITRAVNFRVKSAKLLGGRDAKHDAVINAFALPDGRIYVTKGLMDALDNSPQPEDELAFVVGHEVTHVTQKHGKSQQKKAVTAGILAAILGKAVGGNAGSIVGLGANAYVSHYGRSDEYRADKGGLLAMHRAGYNVDAAVTMLKRLAPKDGAAPNKTLNGWFGSHPLNENRVAKVREMIKDIRAGKNPT